MERRTRSDLACRMMYWDVICPCQARIELLLLEFRKLLLQLVLRM